MSVNSPQFQPFNTAFDKETAQKILQDATFGAEDGELFIEHRKSESLLWDDGRLRSSNYSAHEGFGLRAVTGEVTGYAHSSSMTEAALKEAAEIVRLSLGQSAKLATAPIMTNRKLYHAVNPVDETAFSLKIDTLGEIDSYLREKDKRVVQASVSIASNTQEIEILRPEGQSYSDFRPMARLNVSVIVEHNGRRETGSMGGGGRYGLAPLLEKTYWKALADEALRIAVLNLDAEDAPAGSFDVALGNGWPGILLHEAVGHGLEGDFNRKGTSAFTGLVGTQVAAKGVTVIDDGTLPDRRGSLTFDDEGTATNRTTLIEDGILVGYMQDRQNARLMGVAPTGNGRRESYAHQPMPRMTNTIMLGGEASRDDIIAEVKDGIYAVGFGGGQVDITNGKFVFSCTEAYRVKNGKLGAPVKGATLIGDGPTAMKKIKLIGNDMALDPGIGTCGKAGQWVPVGVGQPSLLIEGLTIGGSAS